MQNIKSEVEKADNIQKLLDYQKDGFLFHGSPDNNIEVLEPRKARDLDESHKFNNDTAVFASDNAASCIIFSLLEWQRDKLEGEWEMNWYDDYVEAKMPLSFKGVLEKNIGYIYVLKRENFKRYHSQFKSHEAVVPVEKIEVTLDDYFKMGGKVEWVL